MGCFWQHDAEHCNSVYSLLICSLSCCTYDGREVALNLIILLIVCILDPHTRSAHRHFLSIWKAPYFSGYSSYKKEGSYNYFSRVRGTLPPICTFTKVGIRSLPLPIRSRHKNSPPSYTFMIRKAHQWRDDPKMRAQTQIPPCLGLLILGILPPWCFTTLNSLFYSWILGERELCSQLLSAPSFDPDQDFGYMIKFCFIIFQMAAI
jgi:hypothetical protein